MATSEKAEFHIIAVSAEQFKCVVVLNVNTQKRGKRHQYSFLTLNALLLPEIGALVPAQANLKNDMRVHTTNNDVAGRQTRS